MEHEEQPDLLFFFIFSFSIFTSDLLLLALLPSTLTKAHCVVHVTTNKTWFDVRRDPDLCPSSLISLFRSLMLVKVKDWTFAEAIFIPIDLKAASWVVCWSVAIAIIN